MTFFDSKEEVLDVQLTRYGRHMLSKGMMRPTFYAFFDDNVTYDSRYGAIHIDTSVITVDDSKTGTNASTYDGKSLPGQSRNLIESRIQEETPYLHTQHSFTGREEHFFDNVEDDLDRVKLNMYEKTTVLQTPMGTSTIGAEKAPAFRVQFLQGEIDKVEFFTTGSLRKNTSTQQLLKVPQIESDIIFKTLIADIIGPQPKFEPDPALVPGRTYTDNTFAAIGPEQILIVVDEENADFDFENFDIEVFEITEQTGSFGEPVLEQLSFIKPVELVRDNLLLDRDEAEILAGQPNGNIPALDPTFVEYYFDINVDSEIDENVICSAISELEAKNVFTDVEIVCPDLESPTSRNLYGSDALADDCPDL